MPALLKNIGLRLFDSNQEGLLYKLQMMSVVLRLLNLKYKQIYFTVFLLSVREIPESFFVWECVFHFNNAGAVPAVLCVLTGVIAFNILFEAVVVFLLVGNIGS